MTISALRAFVVEDHAFQRGGIVTLLRAIGIRHIREASNGREGLEMLERELFPPDVILCDLEMPEVDGIAFLREVAERKLAHGVIIISGREPEILASVEAMVRSLGLAVLGKLGKPVSAEDLWRFLSSDAGAAAPATPAHRLAPGAADLRRALEAREFSCEFQPQVSLATGAVVGVEALARWQPPGATAVGPSEFVPAMVDAGLIAALTDQMLDATCRALTAWAGQGLALTAAVNVSMAVLSDLGTADRLASQVSAHGIEPRRITFEVTETEIMSQVATVLNVLARLRLKGFRLAIDDFGTGYASLAQLNTLPFTELKIDQTFVRNCGQSHRLRNIIRSSIELARRLNVGTVAEGIESRDEWDFLRLAGCDGGQGHYIARPMAEEAIAAFASRPQRHLTDPDSPRPWPAPGERA